MLVLGVVTLVWGASNLHFSLGTWGPKALRKLRFASFGGWTKNPNIFPRLVAKNGDLVI